MVKKTSQGMIDVQTIVDLQRNTVKQWHELNVPQNQYDGFLRLVCDQHKFNYLLWHEEDIARSPNVADAEIAQVKRNIDSLNQKRNDQIEKLDDELIQILNTKNLVIDQNVPLNTETPGSVIDRLSILSLRIYHMEEQAMRQDADTEHRNKAKQKLTILYEQLKDLSMSLSQLLEEIFSGRKRLKVYRQFKMYNDPSLNPYLYKKKT